MTTARDKRLEKAQLKVLFQVPFFAPGVAKLPIEWNDQIETACTDGRKIMWNPTFFDSLQDQELVTVLCHEVMHPMLGHLWRSPPGADHDGWNQACDHAVNLSLKEFGAQVTAKRLADPFPFPKDLPICADPAFAGMAEEQIYARIPKGKGGGQGGQAGGSGKGKPGGQPGARKKFGEFVPAPGDAAQQKQCKTEWEHTLIQSCELNKGRGDLPAGMARIVGDLLNPQVPWYELVRQWLREQASDDYTWTKPNRFYGDSEFILPVLESERIGPIVFATDTSGSIDQECLRHFQSEKQSALDDLRPSRLVDIYCDSKIHKIAEYRIGDQIGTDAPGGGGTSFKPVFSHVGKLDEIPKCLVYLTDLDGDFPDKEPEYPVLWVVFGGQNKAPFGEVVNIK